MEILEIDDIVFGALGYFGWFPPRVLTQGFLLMSIDNYAVPMLSDNLYIRRFARFGTICTN